ncbi:MAG TPA: class I SAM-dependent methyltransferase [Ktedonobacteraceae bacterium]|nr:class I SAM-dependent methyltransferase [Ktedonobacteraceae bacterium]
MSVDPQTPKSTYMMDSENAAEVARLSRQDRLFTRYMGGLFPERSDVSSIHDVLDLACGPGGWAMEVAETFPGMQVTGVDLSPLMVAYAQATASEKGIPNIHFREMDVLQPFDFPDDTFDLVNVRLIFGFMPPAAWPKFLLECMRVTRPGGIIRLTDCENGLSNSLACEQLGRLSAAALKKAGQSFSPDGYHLSITPMLGRLLSDAGGKNIQRMSHCCDYSAGMEAHIEVFQDVMVGYKLAQPFLLRMGVATQQELDRLYQVAIDEMQASNFCGLFFYLTVWGEVAK